MPTARGKGGFISKGIDPVQAPDAPTIALSGLTNGQSYQFEVLAENVFGPSQYSAASASVTPAPTSIEDVFSTYLYEGNGSTQTITNGIDLDGEGGLLWLKARSTTGEHALFDTARGTGTLLNTDSTNLARSETGLASFNSDGFSFANAGSTVAINFNGRTFASWAFRKAPKFFDVVTYTGTGSAGLTVSHNLGSVPGAIFVKSTTNSANWYVYHRSTGNEGVTLLNTTDSVFTGQSDAWNSTTPTDSSFQLGNAVAVNTSGQTYVAYLFAHNDGDGEFGPTADQDIIKCGSVTMDGSGNASITLGFEPSWVLLKRTDSTGSWAILDTMRGWAYSGTAYLQPNTSNAEGNYGSTDVGEPTATGFEMKSWGANASYIYIAIRRGPMKTPESGTEVFDVNTYTASRGPGNKQTTGFPVDLAVVAPRSGTDSWKHGFVARLTGGRNYLRSNNTSAEDSLSAGLALDDMTGYEFEGQPFNNSVPSDMYNLNFRRAPGFFDVVAYEGNGTAGRNVSHNLGVAPEMMIFKRRNNTGSWSAWHKDLTTPSQAYVFLNLTNAQSTATTIWNNTYPALESSFVVGSISNVNSSGDDYIAYLFATLPGVSKVGSYTGNGSSQTIDCGFSAGARFVMTKRTNSTGNWNIFDSERGIVAGNSPRLELNTTDAEDTGHDYLDPNNSGFIVNYVADDDDDSNVSGDTYIFLAIA